MRLAFHWVIFLILLLIVSCSPKALVVPVTQESFPEIVQSESDLFQIGLLSDIHGYANNTDLLAKRLRDEGADIFVILGDTPEHFRASKTDDAREILVVLETLLKYKIPILVIPGNHETMTDYKQAIRLLSDEYDNLIDLEQTHTYSFNNYTFLGIGGYHDKRYLADGGFLLEEDSIKNEISQYFSMIPKNQTIILLTHSPQRYFNADGIDYTLSGDNVGWVIYNDIKKSYNISFHFSGHIHEAGPKSLDKDWNPITENNFSSYLDANPGSVMPWLWNNGSRSKGSAMLITMNRSYAAYKTVFV